MAAVARHLDSFAEEGASIGNAAGGGTDCASDDRLRSRMLMDSSIAQSGPLAPPLHLVIVHRDATENFGPELSKRLTSLRVIHVPMRSAVSASQMSEGMLLQLPPVLFPLMLLLPHYLMAARQNVVVDASFAADLQAIASSARTVP